MKDKVIYINLLIIFLSGCITLYIPLPSECFFVLAFVGILIHAMLGDE